MSKKIELLVFDMAGTTVRDNNEVENCFRTAVADTGLQATSAEINAMMGWSKIKVFETLWNRQLLGKPAGVIAAKVQSSYELFCNILENHYLKAPVLPTPGTPEVFEYLHSKSIKIALNTGFYRKVTDIILKRLNWETGRTLDAVVASNEVTEGRPSPYMVFKIMEKCGVQDVRSVVKIGDTPSDLGEGKNAGCRFTFGVTNGTHTRSELTLHENDGLFDDMHAFLTFLKKEIDGNPGGKWYF